MNLDHDITALRQAIRAHGYTASTVRSYSFYIRDFLGWLGARHAEQQLALGEAAMVIYGVHLKEDRNLGDSAVAQAMSAVSFYLRNVVKRGQIVTTSGRQLLIEPDSALLSAPPGTPYPAPDLTLIRSMLGPAYIDMKPRVPYDDAVRMQRAMRSKR